VRAAALGMRRTRIPRLRSRPGRSRRRSASFTLQRLVHVAAIITLQQLVHASAARLGCSAFHVAATRSHFSASSRYSAPFTHRFVSRPAWRAIALPSGVRWRCL
jgi:hypothetical protein